MNSLLDRLRRLFAGQAQEPIAKDMTAAEGSKELTAVGAEFFLDDSSLTQLMSLVERSREGEYACEETLDLLDEYVDLVARNHDAAVLMPLVKGHLDHCVDCTERYEALIRILEDS